VELQNNFLQNELLSKRLDNSERGVTIKSTLISEFNSKLDNIKSELEKISFNGQNNDKILIQNVIRKIDFELESEDSFIDFLDHFNTVYPQFFESFQKQFPNLNNHDKKLCVYIKMNLDSNEIANILNINKASVNTARYRLRKKLNLAKSEDLNQFIQNFDV